MDLTQSKLTRKEWESVEIPVSPEEKKILNMIVDGYTDVNIHINENLSLSSFIKIDITPETEQYLYSKYFNQNIQEMIKKYGTKLKIILPSIEGSEIKKIKSADNIRFQNLENNIKQNIGVIFEFLLIDMCENLLKNLYNKNNRYAFYLYTLLQLKKQSIRNVNCHVSQFVDLLTTIACKYTHASNIIENAYEFIEKNDNLLKYENKSLFPHQKQLFSICKPKDGVERTPKLILYTAPTGTGKTLSPIGLSNQYRVLFVCVARHIGLALAKSAISVEKKVAFAFGCETASDIRLHYFAAANYTKNKKSGAIAKVDNSIGTKVEIMICDIRSYETAMYYMLAFNDAENIITYWDEPTITMDYETHPLHATIHRNWCNNKIPNVVLSCATLPKENEILSVTADFREKFDNAEVHTITSYDCKKSIPILNKDSYCVLPHTISGDYGETMNCVKYCDENKTILRYFDLSEIVRFIEYVNDEELIEDEYSIDQYFSAGIADITMNSLKVYYLTIFKYINKDEWTNIFTHMKTTQEKKFINAPAISKTKSVDSPPQLNSNVLTRTLSVSSIGEMKPVKTTSSGILITTSDAYTLSDGPTIFLTDDVQKVGQFYIQQSNISPVVFQTIMAKIAKNSEVAQQITKLENLLEAEQNKMSNEEATDDGKESSKDGNKRLSKDAEKFTDEISNLRKEIWMVSLDPKYVPNTKPHQELWTPTGEIYTNAFLPNIDEQTTKSIMTLDIDNNLKVLLLLGIGMFLENPNIQYMEIMKQLADTQRLFIIIASSDYIYGTNYQFCHGFIGKDLKNMTQQKTMQAMGRIGRNNIQQSYTVRFRDDEMIHNLFRQPLHNIETVNMCALFCS